ncbi:MAG: indolepyruvate oxidoreductase subunit beta family protein [Steroidobacterales bacterium]
MMTNDRPIRLTIAALGGQGGGVVADWLVEVAGREQYIVQSTSVPGVAQRTGATIYYLEFYPRKLVAGHGKEPVLALMPQPGDVDVVVASELVEAGRMILRGLVTPDRTTLILSTHRSYTIGEKSALADARVDEKVLLESARAQAKRLIAFDMAAIAEAQRSVISAVILGSIAGSGAMPFSTNSYRDAIRHAGIAVEQSLAAFEAGASIASQANPESPVAASAASAVARSAKNYRASHPRVQRLLERIDKEFPASLTTVLIAGVRRLIDFQDVDYAEAYLDRLGIFCQLDSAAQSCRLSEALARGLALWMSFEDTIRVADLKTRGERVGRVREEVRAGAGELVQVTEFMKPRVEEICGTLPAGVGRYALASPRIRGVLGRWTHDRQISTSTVSGFFFLRSLARLARWRRGTLRFKQEHARIDAWLADIAKARAANYELAVEMAECQVLVKGYGDTHERGLANFNKVMTAARPLADTPDAAAKLRAWREAALEDEQGAAL